MDDLNATPEQKFSQWSEDGVLLPPERLEVRGADAILQHLYDDQNSGVTEITHEIVELNSFSEIVVVQGRAFGAWSEPGGDGSVRALGDKEHVSIQAHAGRAENLEDYLEPSAEGLGPL